jgi:hypothetical protein
MRTLELVYDLDNLVRAWGYLRSNADAAYKNYFRSLYSNYAVADTDHLLDLRDRLKRCVYDPADACKVFQPKPSGLLRPITLLTVEDQIVYQAMVNIIADRLYPKVRGRYNREVFGHLLAPRTCIWFYQKWQSSYARFNWAARRAFADGFVYAARFDLTAFYDSLDHGVLCHFLKALRCDKDFLDLLVKCLNTWTSTQGRIYHNHGIPQGPLSSGLLSEVVLQHFDQNRRTPATVRYFRYVDDIRLFSTNLADLRRVVTWLDLLSKEVGLFPQSGKIDIHQVTDIESELKSVSQPLAEVYDENEKAVDQTLLRAKLSKMSKGYRIEDATEFKFLLGHSVPDGRLNRRLWRVLDRHPELASSILRYFQRYAQLSEKDGTSLVAALHARPRFPSVIAELLDTADGRLAADQVSGVDLFVRKCLADGSLQGADYYAAVMKWAIRRGLVTRSSISARVRRLSSWWAQAEVLAVLVSGTINEPMREKLLNESLLCPVSCVASAAAVRIAHDGLKITVKAKEMQRSAACVLESLKLIRKGQSGVCGIRRYFESLVGADVAINWRLFFRRRYRRVERQAVWCRAFAQTDITAWVNAMDVFDDFLLEGLCRHDAALPAYTLGGIGGILNCTHLKNVYPALTKLVTEIHDKRGDSALSHPVKTKGKARVVVGATGRIKFGYLNRAKKLVRAILGELESKKKW